MASSKGGVTPLTETSDPEESTIPEGYWNWKLPPAANVQVPRVDSPELLAWSICAEPDPAVMMWGVGGELPSGRVGEQLLVPTQTSCTFCDASREAFRVFAGAAGELDTWTSA